MLVAGLKISQEIGGAAGDMAGKGMGALNKGRSMVTKGAVGGLAAVTGYNFAKRRYGAWRQDRKKKGEQRSDLIYETIKGRATGAVKGAGMTIGRGAKKLGGKIIDAAGETKAGAWMVQKGGQIKNKVDDLKEFNRRNKARHEAYNGEPYVDKDGNKYDYNEEHNHYADEKGNVATIDGKAVKYNEQTQKYENQDGSEVRDVKKVTKMGDTAAAMRDGMSSGMTKARALSNQIKDERMAKKQKLFEDAGTSTGQLKRILSDSTASKEKKLGAIMALSIKEGFKNKDHASGRSLVNESKKVIGNNAPLLKKFEDSLNKRYAHLNYDLSSDGGRNKYKQAMDEGRFDGYSQDSTAYNKDTMETLKDYSGVDFKGDIKKTAAKSKQHREAIGEGLAGARDASLGPDGKVFDEATDKVNEFAKLMVDLGGNIATAFGKTAVNQDGNKTINFDANAAMASQKYFENAKSSDLESFNNDLLDPDKISGFLGKQGYDVPQDQSSIIATQIKDALREGLDVSKLGTMARGDNNIEFVKRAIGAIQQNGPDKKRDQIKDNNILVTIKPIV